MSILSRAKTGKDIPIDNVYVIYGAEGSGKTTLASSFPKSKEAPLLYIDLLEGGGGVISKADREFVKHVEIENFVEFDEVITDLINGYTINDAGIKENLQYSTVVIDTGTQLEYMLKEHLKRTNNKETMNLNLWGQNRDNQDFIYNTLKAIHKRTGAYVVCIFQEKTEKDENNPDFDKIIPSVMNAAAHSICAKASFVWYCKVENEDQLNTKTNEIEKVLKFNTIIDSHAYLFTKTRRPKGISIPQKVTNLTFDKFKKNVLDVIWQSK